MPSVHPYHRGCMTRWGAGGGVGWWSGVTYEKHPTVMVRDGTRGGIECDNKY